MSSVIIAVVLLLFAWPQQTPNASVSAQKTATAYFYMISGVLGGSDISVDGKTVCRLHSDTYCTVQVGPGKHTITSNREWWGNSFVLESGKTYYFKLQVRAYRAAGYLANVVPVAPETAEPELRGCTRAGTERF
jgi:Protein of unknown function (DUF2846)